jgi:uncharacterized membrane protein YphA (DoxX/SURF4 family)
MGRRRPPDHGRAGSGVGVNTAVIVISLILRLILGGIFAFAGWKKLEDPQAVASSIQAFKVHALGHPMPDHLVLMGTYAVPWLEVVVGAALLLGFWTRAASLLYALLMASFIALVISVIQRDMDVNCQCLGRFKLFCSGPLGTCKVIENSILMAGSLLLLTIGPGALSLDRLIFGRREPA